MADQHPCPNCGDAVAIGGKPVSMRRSTKEEVVIAMELATCPTCGEQLERNSALREGWQLAANA
jgi:predicted RNA-binding Zn-ribbon protein involved in translation (DUF1610 family)